jgi:V8-like Glu-specific endopeptidase
MNNSKKKREKTNNSKKKPVKEEEVSALNGKTIVQKDRTAREEQATWKTRGSLFLPSLEKLRAPELVSSTRVEASRVGDLELIYQDTRESICGGNDDSQPVEQYNGRLGVTREFVKAHQAAVAQTQWNDNLSSKYRNPGNVSGKRWCSGTMISEDLYLTAGHCFSSNPSEPWIVPRKNNRPREPIPPEEIATNMHVNFNYQVDPQGRLRNERSFPILKLVEHNLGGLDYAIVRVEGNPGSASLFGNTPISKDDAVLRNVICIIGHPAGYPKRIEAGPVTYLRGDKIGYNSLDTLGGNSGSGILHSPSGFIVGVHTDGGCGQNPGAGQNIGVRVSSLIRASPTIASLARPR